MDANDGVWIRIGVLVPAKSGSIHLTVDKLPGIAWVRGRHHKGSAPVRAGGHCTRRNSEGAGRRTGRDILSRLQRGVILSHGYGLVRSPLAKDSSNELSRSGVAWIHSVNVLSGVGVCAGRILLKQHLGGSVTCCF